MAERVIKLDYDPQPRQALLHSTPAKQILFGGSAGGGKSHCVRWDAISFCVQNPGLDAYLFRRTLPELEQSHIRRVKQDIPSELGRYNETKKRFEWANGSLLNFCYCEREDDVMRYQSAEMHVLDVDEATHLTGDQLAFLRTRVRLGSFKCPQMEILPRIVFASNPGGPGHNWIKDIFIDKAPPETLFYDESMRDEKDQTDKGWLSLYIPARMSDNKYLDANYGGSFNALTPELAKALREGDWDAVVGKALHTLTRDKHQVRPFMPPRHWTRFMSMDWGSAAPFAVGWFCVSDGALLAGKETWPAVWLPSGAVILYAEWYGWNGKPNQGLRLDSPAVARRILEMEKERGDAPMDYRIGDAQMWAKSDGPSVAERMMTATDSRFIMRQSQKDRAHNYSEFLARLAGSPTFGADGRKGDYPMFYVTADCRQFWRTVPVLTLDTVNPEKGPNTKEEDHHYDLSAYALRSRPYVQTKEDRWQAEAAPFIREFKSVDPYATR